VSDAIVFLSVADVVQIHADTMRHEGGLHGVRDHGLLEAAVAMPRQRFGGNHLHDGPAAMAAAYLFYLANNHPFLDGNKRAAAMSALVFLKVNRTDPLPENDEMTWVTLAVASGDMDKSTLTRWFADALGGG